MSAIDTGRLTDALAIARRLAARAGRPAPDALEPLAGGRNNQVFRVHASGAPSCVLKLYHADPRDPRDRLAHEWSFLAHVRACGVASTPEALARDIDAHAGLYTFAPGRRLSAGEVEPRHVEAALDFILRINAASRAMDYLPEGSEACFSLEQHLTAVARRVERLMTLDPAAPIRGSAEAFVRGDLRERWTEVRRRVEVGARSLGIPLDATLAEDAIIASPSDFGFHNALIDGETITFIDFEYAGRDDPAKLGCDFFCCPEAPPPAAEFDRFVDGLMTSRAAERCRLLLDAYRVKWACIVLNDFLPLGADRRAFADHRRTEEQCEAQLARARVLLDGVAAHA